MARHLQTISQDWLDTILTKTATLCVAEAGSATGPLGADSSGVETTRYETVTRPLKSEKNFVEMARKAYLKYHVIAILGLQIILESGDHDQQHKRYHDAACHAGWDETTGTVTRPDCL